MADVQLAPGDLVESATHELLNGVPNWSANIQLADMANASPSLAAQIMAALRKRLVHKKHAVGLLAVILLESLVKNAPRHLLPLLAGDTFMSDLVHVLPKRIRDPANAKGFFGSLKDNTRDIQGVERYDKLLLLIESLAHTFGARHAVFAEVYRQLQRSGTIFPKPERDEMAPVVTPPVSAKVLAEKEAEKARNLAALRAAELARLGAEEERRLRERQEQVLRFRDPDARAAIETANLLVDTLNQTQAHEDLRKNELVVQIWEALKPLAQKVHARLTKLAGSGSGDETTLAEMLQANDVCQEAGLFYEGLVKGTVKRRAPVPPAAIEAARAAAAAAAAPAVSSSSSSSRTSPAASPRAAPSSRKSSSASASAAPSPSERERKPVPLLQPPPAIAPPLHGASRKRSSASGSAESTPIAAAAPHVPAPSFDLLSFADALPAVQPQPPPQPPPSVHHQQHRHHTNEAAMYPSVAGAFGSGMEGQPSVPHYAQQDALFHAAAAQPPQQPQQQQHQQHQPSYHAASAARPSPTRASYALAPPPQASGNVDFFSQASVPAAQQQLAYQQLLQQQQQQQQHQPQFGRPAPVQKTPFDDPSPDPFLNLAMRSSPSHAAPASTATAAHQQPQPLAARKKTIAEEFDLL